MPSTPPVQCFPGGETAPLTPRVETRALPGPSHHSQFLCHIRCPAHLQYHPRCPRILLLHTLTSQRKLTESDKDSAVDTQSVCTHTLCRTHIFLTHFLCVAYRHRAHAWLKVFAVRTSHLSISPSPFSCSIRRPCCSRTTTWTPRSCLHLLCRIVPDPKARVWRTSARAVGSLATWPIPRTPQVTSPRSSTRLLLQMVTRCSLKIWTSLKSLTSSKNTHENTRLFGVSTKFEASVSHVSQGDCALQKEDKESMHRETDYQTGREKQKERGKMRFCDQCCRIDVKEKSTEQCSELFSSDSLKILF